MTRCYHCGQEIPEEQLRCGVRLSLLKTRLFDIIKRAGRDGISGEDLYEFFLKTRGAKLNVLKTHIYQINERLESTDWRIEVTRNGRETGIYRLKKMVRLDAVGAKVIQPTGSGAARVIANPKSGA